MISKSCWSWLHNCQSQLCLTKSSCDRDSVPDMCRYLRVKPPANFCCASGARRINVGKGKFVKLSHDHRPIAVVCPYTQCFFLVCDLPYVRFRLSHSSCG